MIIISHAVPGDLAKIGQGAINVNAATQNIQLFIASLFINLGQIGNAIFIICSAWFLIDSSNTNGQKIAHMIGDCFVISVMSVITFLTIGYDLPAKYVIKQFLPITFSNYWFLTCYILFYCIHPLLNIILKQLNQKNLLLINIVFIIIYNIIGFVMSNSLFFYSQIIGFIGIYFTTAYIKKYLNNTLSSSKINIWLLLIGIIGWIGIALLTNCLGLNISFLSNELAHWSNFTNPCFLLISYSVFNIARQYTFYNKIINYFSSMSLLIYMFHCNRIIMDYAKYDIYNYIWKLCSDKYLIWWIILFSIALFIFGLLASLLYRNIIQKYVNCIFEKLYYFIKYIYDKVSTFILKLN